MTCPFMQPTRLRLFLAPSLLGKACTMCIHWAELDSITATRTALLTVCVHARNDKLTSHQQAIGIILCCRLKLMVRPQR